MFKIEEMQKKGAFSMNNTVDKLIGALITIILVVAFAPQIYDGLDSLANVTGLPTWLVTVASPVITVGILYLIMKAFK